MDEVAPGYVAVARVLGAWGVKGALKVEPLAPPQALAPGRKVRIAGEEREIHQAQRSGKFVRLTIAGIEDREAAAALRNTMLQARETDLPPLPDGQYYRFQLLGLTVVGVAGDEIGRVLDIISAPENDVYVIQSKHGEVLIPAVDDVVQDIDLVARQITIDIVPGLLP